MARFLEAVRITMGILVSATNVVADVSRKQKHLRLRTWIICMGMKVMLDGILVCMSQVQVQVPRLVQGWFAKSGQSRLKTYTSPESVCSTA